MRQVRGRQRRQDKIKSKQTKQTQKINVQIVKTIKPSTVYVQLSTLHDSHRLICWKEGTQENSVDVKHPETGVVGVGVTAETVRNEEKLKVQSVSTESLDTWLSVQ